MGKAQGPRSRGAKARMRAYGMSPFRSVGMGDRVQHATTARLQLLRRRYGRLRRVSRRPGFANAPTIERYKVVDGLSGMVEGTAFALELLPDLSQLLTLEEHRFVNFLAMLKAGEISEIGVIRPEAESLS